MIRLENVNKVYENDFYALKDINLLVNENETIGVVGLSGSGKSTLIRLINGLIKPTSGNIWVANKNINDLNKKDLNRIRMTIGMVFQSFNLLQQLTVYENIELALKISGVSLDERNLKVRDAISLVGLDSKINNYPKTLSGGEKQRVAIARAIVNNPKVLLCDEITSALDQKTSLEIINVLKKIKEQTKVTIIFISHQLDMVRLISDRVIVMDQGLILEDNTTKEIFINPKEIATKNLVEALVNTNIKLTKDTYKLVYLANTLNESILSDVIKKYNIDTNIIFATSIELKDETIGFLWIEIKGSNKDLAIKALKERIVIKDESV